MWSWRHHRTGIPHGCSIFHNEAINLAVNNDHCRMNHLWMYGPMQHSLKHVSQNRWRQAKHCDNFRYTSFCKASKNNSASVNFLHSMNLTRLLRSVTITSYTQHLRFKDESEGWDWKFMTYCSFWIHDSEGDAPNNELHLVTWESPVHGPCVKWWIFIVSVQPVYTFERVDPLIISLLVSVMTAIV